MRIRNKEIRQRQHRKAEKVKEIIKGLKGKGSTKVAGEKAAPKSKPAAKPVAAEKKPAAAKKAPAKKKEEEATEATAE